MRPDCNWNPPMDGIGGLIVEEHRTAEPKGRLPAEVDDALPARLQLGNTIFCEGVPLSRVREIFVGRAREDQSICFVPGFPAFSADNRGALRDYGDHFKDPVRSFTVGMALETIKRESLDGDMAEVGVYKGDMALVYQRLCPEKRLYLFDTFEGFPAADLDAPDDRFADAPVEAVKARFPVRANLRLRKGYFPDTTVGLESNRFCFVQLDADLYAPTKAGLEFFYPRMVRGGYVFAHDYSSFESNRGVKRAVQEFLADKSELVIEIPDRWGSVLFRKI